MDDYIYLVDILVGYTSTGEEIHYCEIVGSGATKPTTSSNGQGILAPCSICTESDNGKVSFWDVTSGWVEQFSFQA